MNNLILHIKFIEVFIILIFYSNSLNASEIIDPKCEDRAYIFYAGSPFLGYYDKNFQLLRKSELFDDSTLEIKAPSKEDATKNVLEKCVDSEGFLNGVDENGKKIKVKYKNTFIDPDFFSLTAEFINTKSHEKPIFVVTSGFEVSKLSLIKLKLPETDLKIITLEAQARLLESTFKTDFENKYVGKYLSPLLENSFEIHAFQFSKNSQGALVSIVPKEKISEKLKNDLSMTSLLFTYDLQNHAIVQRLGFIQEPTFIQIGESILMYIYFNPDSPACLECRDETLKQLNFNSMMINEENLYLLQFIR